jgi:hypothetical protein
MKTSILEHLDGLMKKLAGALNFDHSNFIKYYNHIKLKVIGTCP